MHHECHSTKQGHKQETRDLLNGNSSLKKGKEKENPEDNTFGSTGKR